MGDEDRGGLGRPPDIEKPLFVYGNLKPGELGYGLISQHVLDSEPGQLSGYIWVRDGVPLAELSSGGHGISGYVLTLAPEGYGIVGGAEPATYYRWRTAFCDEPAGVEVNVLAPIAALRPDKGGGDALDQPWTTASDPLFTFGLATVAAVLESDGGAPFVTRFNDSPAWKRYYRLQSAYMLACSILERTAFWIAPSVGPTAAVNKVGHHEDFVKAVHRAGVAIPNRAVHRADDPKEKATLNKAAQFANWAYQIRSNMMHRGKSAGREAELVRTALIDLHDVLRIYLLAKVPALREAWANIEPEREVYGWRIKDELVAPHDG